LFGDFNEQTGQTTDTHMSKQGKNLRQYRQKRKFEESPEPEGDKGDFSWASERPVFVIQKHDASSLHYDFRLEADGVLKSWVVPKGPSTDPGEKRLALPTEDHPLDYADFEGVIPKGHYGAGAIMIWDRGSYRNLKADQDDSEPEKAISEQIDDGHVTVWLNGDKLKGGYALIRTDLGDEERWLLIKMDDDEADARRNPTSTEADSVASGRSIDDIHDGAEDT
jgi:DNA ligase D-like protein (predicted 3'-phosphoesterase)